jgi:hypothetical protein
MTEFRAGVDCGTAGAAFTAAVTRHAELVGRLQSSTSQLAEGQMAASAVAQLETDRPARRRASR